MHSSKVVGMLMCLLVFVAMASARAKNPAVHDVYHITFTAPVHIGDALLPAGDYTILHEMEGQDHYMVFREDGKKTSDLKVKCTLVQLGYKASKTETIYELNASNERVLEQIVFAGDTARHVF